MSQPKLAPDYRVRNGQTRLDTGVHYRGGVRLLDVDPELGGGLGEHEFAHARGALVAPLFALAAGAVFGDAIRAAVPGATAIIVVSGSLLLDLELAGHVCTRLAGPRQVVTLDEAPAGSLPTRVAWSASAGTEIGVLDARTVQAGQRWPRVIASLLARVGQQAQDAFALQAIAQLPRVEERLLAYFWSIADRYGRITPDGMLIELRVTHATLGRMVGARRPTISLALKALAQRGMLEARHQGWLLAAESLHELHGDSATGLQP